MTDIPGNGGEAKDFLAHIETLLTNPAGRLSVSSQDLFADIDRNLLSGLMKHTVGDAPSILDFLKESMPGTSPAPPSSANLPLGTLVLAGASGPVGIAAALGLSVFHNVKRFKHANKQRYITRASSDFVITRATVGLRDSERAALRAMAALRAENLLTWEPWRKFYCQLTWTGGKAEIIAPSASASSKHIDDARKFLMTVCSHAFPDHEQFLALTGATLGEYAKKDNELGRMIASLITSGARWLRPEDIATSRVYKTTRTLAALQIGGFKPGQQPIYFDGNESLATIAGPGTGKSAAQVIPNLLTYPGSCFVLDVKDELWAKTASHRRRAFGPVYRFAPTDPSGNSHSYNPFDIIPLDAAAAERECQVLASMIIPDRPGNRDPYWDSKAREYLWAFAMAVTFKSNPDWRNLGSVSRLFAMRTHFPDPSHYASSDTCTILQGLDDLAQQLGIPALKQASDAIHGMLNNQKTLTSILDTARSNLNPLTRSPTASAAMKRSDWTPLDLRRRPGTTVYFCLKPDDMKAYAPLVRLVFQQHVSQLTRNFTPKKGELPITFFLDEMPQLGYMPNMSDLVDVGRGAAVRMWMFMQYMSQIRDTYQIKGPGLIEACRVRSYISPDTEAAKAIAPLLGETRNLFSGEKKPLVYPHELAGREFVDDIVVVATGEHPARLSKLNYYTDARLNPLTELAPPHVSRLLPAPPQGNGQQPASAQPIVPAKAKQPAIALKPAPAVQHVQRNRDPVLRPRNT